MISELKELYSDIWTHAIEEHPYECCGLVVNGKYIPMENIHEIPNHCFEIKPEVFFNALLNYDIDAVIHSHVGYSHLSSADMIQQKAMGIPWGVAFLDDDCRKDGIYFWGEGIKKPDLEGRVFVHGLYDCYSVICDYYEREYPNVKMPFVPRDYGWWGKENLVFNNLRESGFIEIDLSSNLEIGDILFFKMGYRYLSHAMLYVGKDELLHHPLNCLSGKVSVYHPYIKRVDNIFRSGDI